MIVVSNTSPITNLAAIEQLPLLNQLYGTILIPEAVKDELTNAGRVVPGTVEVQTFTWLQVRLVVDRERVAGLLTEIDPGEAEAIVLAAELNADRLILDDSAARVVAQRLGLNVIGLLGMLLVAKRQGLISAVRPVMDELISQANFRIGSQLYARIIQAAGE